jgi:DNA polymerase-3 subunit gamma/tau
MSQALYRKYRSKSFDEVVGQDHITKTLRSAIEAGKISHAYLFTGPRGTGKTSVARILAHEVNQLPYEENQPIHLDIIEIDGASNRRIDEIRDLRERVHIAPTSAKYKVYIVDEVHMLTKEAFNALLKTLEEPPAHCIFILATTEVHKLPETIISRTQRFNFKPIDKVKIIEHFAKIAKKEKIDITKEALELISDHGEGSMRDSLSLLDQLSATGKTIDEESVRQALGLPPEESILSLLTAINSGDSRSALEILSELKNNGANPASVAASLSSKLRQDILQNSRSQHTTPLLRQLLNVPSSSQPQEYLEITILEVISLNKPSQTSAPQPHSPKQDKTISKVEPAESANKKPEPKKELNINVEPAIKKTKITPGDTANLNLDCWPEVIEQVKTEAASLYTALRLAHPVIERGDLVLAFQFPLHQKKVNQAKNIDIIGKSIEDLTGIKVRLKCIVDKTASPFQPRQAITEAVTKEVEERSDSINVINNIFGASEVLES